MIYSRFLGVGSYLPQRVMTNDDLARIVDTSDEWIYSRTGMKERHIAREDENTSDMAAAAARAALLDAGVSAGELDLIILATTTPDLTFPASACRVQALVGATCPGFDIQAVCTGFIFALATADAYIKTGLYKKILVIGADKMSGIVDWTDRGTCVLFGDGAGAVVLGAADTPGILASRLHAAGEKYDILKTTDAGKVFMSGQEVFKIAVGKMPEVSEEVVRAAGLSNSDIDWFIPHQANVRIIDAAMKHLDLAPEKVVRTVQKHANTSSASIPLALDAAIRDGRIKRGDNILMTAMGGGFTWGSVVAKY
ncbi:MAG: ketoacyl-ACP synthase III [Alphaproteobacteria bacterium]|nr:ketoacyl-ACP synthase III [Alphaproteobacteria bacterium]